MRDDDCGSRGASTVGGTLGAPTGSGRTPVTVYEQTVARVKSRDAVRGQIGDYEKLGRVGEGTYGVVYRGREHATGQIVALKKVRMDKEKDGIPVTAVREMGILMRCRKHPHIVELLRVVQGKNNGIFLVFEYCEHDVGKLMQSMRRPFSVSEVKTLTTQLLSAVRFLHGIHVFHRDLKMSNLLLNNKGELKLCDLGLARQFAPKPDNTETYTAKVVTLWYRAPELLLGQRNYDCAIDMWAVGCILAEFLKHKPIFPGKTETDTVNKHFAELGAPNEQIWPGWASLPFAKTFQVPNQPYNLLSIHFQEFGVEGVDLLVGLLTYDPRKRIRATQALGAGLSQSPHTASVIAHTRPAKGLLRPEGTIPSDCYPDCLLIPIPHTHGRETDIYFYNLRVSFSSEKLAPETETAKRNAHVPVASRKHRGERLHAGAGNGFRGSRGVGSTGR